MSKCQNEHDLQSVLEGNGSYLPSCNTWEEDMKKQNQDYINDPDSDDDDSPST